MLPFCRRVQLEEAGKERVVGQRRQSTEVECAAGSLSGSVLDVTGAVAQTTAHQLRLREAAELLRGGEEENFIVFGIERFAAAPGKAFYGVRMPECCLRWEIRKVMSISHGS